MTDLSPPPASAPPRVRRAVHWISFAFFTLFGLGLATSPAWSGTRSSATATTGWLLLGLAVLTVPLITWTRFLAPARPERSVRTHENAVEVRFRTGTPAATAVLGTVWAALASWAVVAGGITGGGLFAVPFVLLFAALVPDALRASVRHPHLLLDADAVRLHGWSLDGEIAWADISGVDVVSVRPQRPVIRLIARPDATSMSRTWHRFLVHLDLETDEAVLDIPLLALDDPGRVAALLSILRGLPRDERLLQLEGAGRAFLRGELQLDRPPDGGF